RTALAPVAQRAPQRGPATQPARAGSALGAPAGVRRAGRLTLAAAAAALALPLAAAPATPAPRPLGCLIEPDRVAEVGSQVVGLVERIHVERGDVVGAGQPLINLRADVERANAAAAETRARIDADVLAARASLELADQKVKRA